MPLCLLPSISYCILYLFFCSACMLTWLSVCVCANINIRKRLEKKYCFNVYRIQVTTNRAKRQKSTCFQWCCVYLTLLRWWEIIFFVLTMLAPLFSLAFFNTHCENPTIVLIVPAPTRTQCSQAGEPGPRPSAYGTLCVYWAKARFSLRVKIKRLKQVWLYQQHCPFGIFINTGAVMSAVICRKKHSEALLNEFL